MVIYAFLSLLCILALLLWKKLKLREEIKIYFVLGTAIGFLGLASLLAGGDEKLETDEKGGVLLERKEHGHGAYTQKLVLWMEGVQQDYSVRIEAEHLSGSEVNEAFISAIEMLEKSFYGDKGHPDCVKGEVYPKKNFVIEVDSEDDSQNKVKADVSATYSFQPSGVVASDGTLRDDRIAAEGSPVQVTAELKCDGRQVEHVFYFMAFPDTEKSTDDIIEDLGEEIIARNAGEGGYLSLPSEIDGVDIRWSVPEKSGTYNILLLGVFAAVGLFVAKREDKKKKAKEKRIELERGYPMMVSALSLLIGSGMTVTAAWERIVSAYLKRVEDGRKRDAVYEEMLLTSRQIKDGKSEKESLTYFAEHTDLGIYRKLISMILQNLRKGGRDLDLMLEREVENAYIMLRNQAKTKGAEASTKMLVPMMLSLLVVIVVIIVPAIFTMDV